jgi:hypothetical protein
MKIDNHIGAILAILRESPGLEPEQRDRLDRHVRALRHALRTRNIRRAKEAVGRIAQEVAKAL